MEKGHPQKSGRNPNLLKRRNAAAGHPGYQDHMDRPGFQDDNCGDIQYGRKHIQHPAEPGRYLGDIFETKPRIYRPQTDAQT